MSTNLRVLVIDDNRDAADSLARLVRLWGHEVRAAYDESALEIRGDFRPNVVLLDVGMPRMDGFEMARQLRSEPTGSPLKIVAVTGFHDEKTERRCYDAGFDHFLVKPVNAAALERLLTEYAVSRPRGEGEVSRDELAD